MNARLWLLRRLPSPALRLVEGFWATPLAIALAGLALAVAVQTAPEGRIAPAGRAALAAIDVSGARTALSVVAGGMVSLIGMVFSLTFVALSITAQQLSPRILDYVLKERSAQALLGLALATLLFGATTLTLGDSRGAWRLGLATPVALLLAAATLVMVVVFAQGMTRVMRAEEMVSRIGSELAADIRRLAEPPSGCRAVEGDVAAFEAGLAGGATVAATRAGYVGVVDYGEIARIAAGRDLRVAFEVRESEFLLPGVPVARLSGGAGDEALAEAIERALNLTDRRETHDTAGYEAAALCEAALRALSPGINDPATAISCLNRLFEALAVLVSADSPPPRLLAPEGDAADPPVILRPPREAPEFIENTVTPVLGAARGDRRVVGHIAIQARRLHALARRAREREAVAALIEATERAG